MILDKETHSIVRRCAEDIKRAVDVANLRLEGDGVCVFYPSSFQIIVDGQACQFRMGDYEVKEIEFTPQLAR